MINLLSVGTTVLTVGVAALGAKHLADDALSWRRKDGWDWQYKGNSIHDRVGNFVLGGDPKSRYNNYLRNYNEVIGYGYKMPSIELVPPPSQSIAPIAGARNYGLDNTGLSPVLTQIGNLTGATREDANNLLLVRKQENVGGYVVSYNSDKGRPNWVAFKIDKNSLGSVRRENDFRPDYEVHKPVSPSTFPSGFDMGHAANSAAFTANKTLNSLTYLMSNMYAEAPALNQGPWASLEIYLNNKVSPSIINGAGPLNNNSMYVITGGSGTGGVGSKGYIESQGGVEVPKILWKVAIFVPNGMDLKEAVNSQQAKALAVAMPNMQNVNPNWQRHVVTDLDQLRRLTGVQRFVPTISEEQERKLLSDAGLLPNPENKAKILNIDINDIGPNFRSDAANKARSRGIHNPLFYPLFDTDKSLKGFVLSNKNSYSESFEMARYNASMRNTGRFNSVVDVEDMNTFELILRADKGDLTEHELRTARMYDRAVNSPSLSTRINEFVFLPINMGRVYKEEKGFIPSLFGAVGGLIDQAYLVNNPALIKSYKKDGENYFATKQTFFQDLLENSAAGLIASVSSVATYLAVGEPIKAMISQSILSAQESVINASKMNVFAKVASGGSIYNTPFLAEVMQFKRDQPATAFYSANNPTLSLYWFENYARIRGATFFEATAREFLLNKISPYKIDSKDGKYKQLLGAINDYTQALASPADIVITKMDGEITVNTHSENIWQREQITVNGETINLETALARLQRNAEVNGTLVTQEVKQAITDQLHNKYQLKIVNVSLERNMDLAQKLQKILNLVPMPWHWGMFTGPKEVFNGPMIGNLVDIEGFTRYINAAVNNQGFWGAANEFMVYHSGDKTKAHAPAYRILNHMATMTRALLAFNDRGGQSQRELAGIKRIAETYVEEEQKILSNKKQPLHTETGYTVIDNSIDPDTGAVRVTDDELAKLLANEAHYQNNWKSQGESLNKIKLGSHYHYVNKTRGTNNLGFILNTIDRNGTYMGMKIASTKISAAKWIIGGIFIPHLLAKEFIEKSGLSLGGTALAHSILNTTSTNTTIQTHSTNLFSYTDVARYMGATGATESAIGVVETLVNAGGLAVWAYNNSAFTPETHARLYTLDRLVNTVSEYAVDVDAAGNKVFQAVPKTEAEFIKALAGKEEIALKLKTGQEVGMVVAREASLLPGTEGKVRGLHTLHTRISKNMTSFGISLALSLAAMQTARYVVSSVIDADRQMFGSSFAGFWLLGVPSILLGAATTIDNAAHLLKVVGGGFSAKPLNVNYWLTSQLTKKVVLPALQGYATLLGRSGTSAAVTLGLTAAALFVGYVNRWTPIQGDVNGPKLDAVNSNAVLKLAAYNQHIQAKVAMYRQIGKDGNESISDSVSPLEVNAALLSIALHKMMAPTGPEVKGSTAYIVAIQSPTPIFQYYSVIKRVVDKTGNSYATVGLGIQGPPILGIAPINFTLPIAYALNSSRNAIQIRTGYMGTGLILNEHNKDGVNIADIFNMYSQVALWSKLGLWVSKPLISNVMYRSQYQMLATPAVGAELPLVQGLRAGRTKFLDVGRVGFEIAAQSARLMTADLRAPGYRLTRSSIGPAAINAVIAGGLTYYLLSVLNAAGAYDKDANKEPDFSFNNAINSMDKTALAGGVAIAWGVKDYVRNTLIEARVLSQLERDILIASTDAKFDKAKVDFISQKLYSNPHSSKWLRTAGRISDTAFERLSVFKGDKLNMRKLGLMRAGGMLAAGALWTHFITDPKSGLVNPELAYGDLRQIKDGTHENLYDGFRRNTHIAINALFLGVGLSTLTRFTAATVFFSPLDPEVIFAEYKYKLEAVAQLRDKVSSQSAKSSKGLNRVVDGAVTAIRKMQLSFATMRLEQVGTEVQILLEEARHADPKISSITKDMHKALGGQDPRDNVKHKVAEGANRVMVDLQQKGDTTLGTDINSIARTTNHQIVKQSLDSLGDPTIVDDARQTANRSALLKSMRYLHGANMRIRTRQYTQMGLLLLTPALFMHTANAISASMGFKDFQDVFIGDKDIRLPSTQILYGFLDFLKVYSKHDRRHHYEIARGLVGPNMTVSNGEFLINPASTTKGAIADSLSKLNKTIIVNSPSTFIGIEVGGITVRPDDHDVRVRDYFQLQSASQDFSSAMYSMSPVFGFKSLAARGFLPNVIIAELKGVNDFESLNSHQLRSFGAAIITAVASQPIRLSKDRIRFTAPDRSTLEAMQTSKALSLSLGTRYKRLQALSYGTDTHIGLYSLMNNMQIADPAMQKTFLKALLEIGNNDTSITLGELNQNAYMGRKFKIDKLIFKGKDNNPFEPLRLSEQDSNNEDAFANQQGIALQLTTNQYINNNPIHRLKTFFEANSQVSAIQGMLNALPFGLGLIITAATSMGLALLGITTIAKMITDFGTKHITKENTALFKQASQYYDGGKWFSNHPVEGVEIPGGINPTTGENVPSHFVLKRSGVVFFTDTVQEAGLRELYGRQANALSAALASTFDMKYMEFYSGTAVDGYGSRGDEYIKAKLSRNNTPLENYKQPLPANDARGVLEQFYTEHVQSMESFDPSTRPDLNKLLDSSEDFNLAKRLQRAHASEFTPVMQYVDTGVTPETVKFSNSGGRRLAEHMLDSFTQKQVLDAYLEGQYLASLKEGAGPDIVSKQNFIEKYYKGATYSELLQAAVEGELRIPKGVELPEGKFISHLNIFGKDRMPNMSYSINLMTEVYAAKFDHIIDTYFDVMQSQADLMYAESPNANLFSEYVDRDLVVDVDGGPLGQDRVKKVIADRRNYYKAHLRSTIHTRLESTVLAKKHGSWFDRLVDKVVGGTVRDNINRISLEATNASIEVIQEVRTGAGNLFSSKGGHQTIEAQLVEAQVAAELELRTKNAMGLSGDLPGGAGMAQINYNSSRLSAIDSIERLGHGIGSLFQMVQFVGINLLALRAGASIASSKTEDREKEMAREELAEMAFNNMFGALFFTALLSSDAVKRSFMPGALGFGAGYASYQMFFADKSKSPIGAGVGVIASITGATMLAKNTSSKWGAGLLIMGITMFSRGLLDSAPNMKNLLGSDAVNSIVFGLEAFKDNSVRGIRNIQDNAGPINVIGGLTVAGVGASYLASGYAFKRTSIGLIAIGSILAAAGFMHSLDKSNTKAEVISKLGLMHLATIAATPVLEKAQIAVGNYVGKTIQATLTENIKKNAVGKAAANLTASIAAKVPSVGLAAGAARLAGRAALGLARLGSGFFLGPWGLGITLLSIAVETALILAAPEMLDEATSRLTHLPTQLLGEYGGFIVQPSNTIYREKRYKDIDPKNVLYYGTAMDAIKLDWTQKIQALEDTTGRQMSAYNTSSFDAPLVGYRSTGEGYGPGFPDPLMDFTLAQRGRQYMSLVLGRQFWNSRLDGTFNFELAQKHMTLMDDLILQHWTNSRKNAVDAATANMTQTSQPIVGARIDSSDAQYKQLIDELAFAKNATNIAAQAQDIINKPHLLIATQVPALRINHDQTLLVGKVTQAALRSYRSKDATTGKASVEVAVSVAPSAEVTATEHFRVTQGNNTVESFIVQPLIT
jgi:endonuclease G